MTRVERLKQLFDRLGVSYETPGFYDHPSFIEAETNDSSFLENYADYVGAQVYPDDYLERARSVIIDVARFLDAELAREGRLGACVDISMTLSRILEKEGIWNYIAVGGLRIEFSATVGLSPTRFEPIMASTNPAVAGHVWLCAPPYHVVDIAVGYQPYSRGEAQHIDHPIIVENVEAASYTLEDLMESDAVRETSESLGRTPILDDLYRMVPGLRERIAKYGPFSVRQQDATFSYFPIRVSAPDSPLEQARNLTLSGRGPLELYEAFRTAQALDDVS